jgi:hypothetical protein
MDETEAAEPIFHKANQFASSATQADFDTTLYTQIKID